MELFKIRQKEARMGIGSPISLEERRAAHNVHVLALRHGEKAKVEKLRVAKEKNKPRSIRKMECDHAGVCVPSGVQVALVESKGLMFCKNCPDPNFEGSLSVLCLL
jgi:hypothetical protein